MSEVKKQDYASARESAENKRAIESIRQSLSRDSDAQEKVSAAEAAEILKKYEKVKGIFAITHTELQTLAAGLDIADSNTSLKPLIAKLKEKSRENGAKGEREILTVDLDQADIIPELKGAAAITKNDTSYLA